jgi:hypothetical protein
LQSEGITRERNQWFLYNTATPTLHMRMYQVCTLTRTDWRSRKVNGATVFLVKHNRHELSWTRKAGYRVSNSYWPVLILGHKDASTIHTHTHSYTHSHTLTHIHSHTQTLTHTHTHTHTHTLTLTHIHSHTHTHTHMTTLCHHVLRQGPWFSKRFAPLLRFSLFSEQNNNEWFRTCRFCLSLSLSFSLPNIKYMRWIITV